METQNNFPTPQDSSSGANTVLLVIIVIILAIFGIWWYKHRGVANVPPENGGVNVNVTLPPNKDSGSTSGTSSGNSGY